MLRVYCENGEESRTGSCWERGRAVEGGRGSSDAARRCRLLVHPRKQQGGGDRSAPRRREPGEPSAGKAPPRAGGRPGPGLEAPEPLLRRRRPEHGDALRPVHPATHPLPPPAPPPPSPPAPLSLSRLEPRQKQREAAGRDATRGPRARPD